MPTYTESLFEPLEAWIAGDTEGPGITDEEATRLRHVVARMLLEHAGRARQGFVPAEDRSRPFSPEELATSDRLSDVLDELQDLAAQIRTELKS